MVWWDIGVFSFIITQFTYTFLILLSGLQDTQTIEFYAFLKLFFMLKEYK